MFDQMLNGAIYGSTFCLWSLYIILICSAQLLIQTTVENVDTKQKECGIIFKTDNIKFALLCLKTALICQDALLKGICCWTQWDTVPSSCPMNTTLALDVLDLAGRQNLVLSVSSSYLWSDGGYYPVGGARHCQEGLCWLCRNILIGAIWQCH